MTQAERKLIKNYIKKLEETIDTYNNANPIFNGIQEKCVFDVISEIMNIFSNDIPSLKDAAMFRNGTAIRDANSIIGILNYYLAKEDELSTLQHESNETANSQMTKIFISHRRTDKDIAELIENFLVSCGVPSNNIFCSSLPGNDIKEKISSEIKGNIQCSVLNFILLSKDYYNSSYCQNEAGIIWYLDTPKIVIALPEINENNMLGFLNNEHKIRRLDNRDDIFTISDIVAENYVFSISGAKLNANVSKLNESYSNLIKSRKNVLYPDAKGYYSTTIIRDRKLTNGYCCYMINGLLPTGEQYVENETHWIFYNENKFPKLSEGNHIRFKPQKPPRELRNFDDLEDTRNIYISALEIL